MSDSAEARVGKSYWAGIYGRGAATYGGVAFFTEAGRRLVDLAEIAEGARVLDVSTGRGANIFPAAERVGATGHVVSTDLAEEMVRETEADIRRRDLENAEVQQMDTEELTFADASFDVLLCGFALYFLPHIDQTLAGFLRVLTPGGRLAITGPDLTKGSAAVENPLWEVLAAYAPRSQRVSAFLSDQRELWRSVEALSWQERQASGAMSFPLPNQLEAALRQAGFVEVRSLAEEAELVARDEAEWWTGQWSHMPRSGLELLEPEILEEFRADVLAKLGPRKRPDGTIHERARYMFTLATRPVS